MEQWDNGTRVVEAYEPPRGSALKAFALYYIIAWLTVLAWYGICPAESRPAGLEGERLPFFIAAAALILTLPAAFCGISAFFSRFFVTNDALRNNESGTTTVLILFVLSGALCASLWLFFTVYLEEPAETEGLIICGAWFFGLGLVYSFFRKIARTEEPNEADTLISGDGIVPYTEPAWAKRKEQPVKRSSLFRAYFFLLVIIVLAVLTINGAWKDSVSNSGKPALREAEKQTAPPVAEKQMQPVAVEKQQPKVAAKEEQQAAPVVSKAPPTVAPKTPTTETKAAGVTPKGWHRYDISDSGLSLAIPASWMLLSKQELERIDSELGEQADSKSAWAAIGKDWRNKSQIIFYVRATSIPWRDLLGSDSWQLSEEAVNLLCKSLDESNHCQKEIVAGKTMLAVRYKQLDGTAPISIQFQLSHNSLLFHIQCDIYGSYYTEADIYQVMNTLIEK